MNPIQKPGTVAAGEQGGFDVVTVPDFSGTKAYMFELRTLFFLASWIENAGKARNFPLHLACIGKPPASVKWLAQKCNAQITIHEPMEIDKCIFLNKMRGFEVKAQTKQLLLLDTDVLVLGDISGLAELGECIAVAIDHLPGVSEADWQKIYRSLNISLPCRVSSLRWQLGLPRLKSAYFSTQEAEQEAMFPYYNGGILLCPWNLNLQNAWRENIFKIASLFQDDKRILEGYLGAIMHCDQTGLSTTVEQFKQDGVQFRQLPRNYHSNWMHLYRRTVSLKQTKLLHAFGLFQGIKNDEISVDYKTLGRHLRQEWRLNDSKRISARMKYLMPAIFDAYRLNRLLRKYYRTHVREALQKN